MVRCPECRRHMAFSDRDETVRYLFCSRCKIRCQASHKGGEKTFSQFTQFSDVRDEEITRQAQEGFRNLNISVLKRALQRAGYSKVCINCGTSIEHDKRRSTYCSHPCSDHVSRSYFWSWIRDDVLALNPQCLHNSCTEDSEEIHHKIPIYLGGHPWDRSNLVALCHDHHSKMHTKEAEMRAIGKIKHDQSTLEQF